MQTGCTTFSYRDDQTLNACWAEALALGVPIDDCQPAGSMVPMVPVPDDSLWSELILRAFEATYGRGGFPQDPYPPLGFKPDLRAIARNLDLAAKLLVEFYKIQPNAVLIPAGWLIFQGELAWARSSGTGNPLRGVHREITGTDHYKYLALVWPEDAWTEPKPYIPGCWCSSYDDPGHQARCLKESN